MCDASKLKHQVGKCLVGHTDALESCVCQCLFNSPGPSLSPACPGPPRGACTPQGRAGQGRRRRRQSCRTDTAVAGGRWNRVCEEQLSQDERDLRDE